ncbi:NAF1 domain protein, partial [Ancylostoma duodenale]
LQRYTCEIRLKKFKEDHPDGVPDRKKSKNEVVIDTSDFQNEYDTLPPLENLSIHCDESIPLEVVGHVTSVVDCLVVIQSEGGVALDFDSVLFDKAAKLQVGMKVYYAPKAEQYTRTVIETQLKEPEEVGDYSSEDEAVFSDDEKEREYRARKSAQARSAKEAAATGSNERRGQKRRVQFSESTSRGGGRGRGGQNRGQHRGRGGSWNWHSERGGYPG